MKQTAILLLFISCLAPACMKDATKYRDLLNNKEIVYPGPVNQFKVFQGHLRIRLQWQPSPDPSIIKYVIYWNNKNDSLLLDATNKNTLDSVSVEIKGLGEYVQNFVLHTLDGLGNRSIGQSLSGVRIYGPLYISSLVNRQLDANRPPKALNKTTYRLYFSAADTIMNLYTQLDYLNTLQQPQTLFLSGKADSLDLDQAPAGTKVALRSSFIPVHRAIDTFKVTYSDTITLK